MAYIDEARDEATEDGCVFCDLLARPDEDVFILKRTANAFVIMNLFPYNPGHMLISPLRHVGEFPELTQEELAETGRLMQESMEVLKAHMAPDGFNIGMNLGRVAGAGVLGHAHYHVVPRWSGDANFMPVTGETRVMPEDVATTYRKLLPLFPSD